METIEHIRFIIDKIRPFLMNDGGDVKLIGACADCTFGDNEIKDTVESILTSEIPEVIEVRNITNSEI